MDGGHFVGTGAALPSGALRCGPAKLLFVLHAAAIYALEVLHDGGIDASDQEAVGAKRRKGIYILPNLFTLAALLAGSTPS